MITVFIPTKNYSEIRYTIGVLLGTFLGLNYSVKFNSEENDVIVSCGAGKIVLESPFFEKNCILDKENIPSQISKENVVIDSKTLNLISLFDGNTIMPSMSYPIDILASTFFMLTRWEEYILPQRDAHNRFTAKSSIAYKFGFLERPIVNEYVEFLWLLLKGIGCEQKRSERKYELTPTHDVDRPYLFKSFIQNFMRIGGFIKKLQFLKMIDFCKHAIAGSDPWDTHGLFMDLSENANVKSYFFFLPRGLHKNDGDYDVADPKIKKLYNRIKERGHHIGFHPSYNTYNDIDLFKKEKRELEDAVGEKMKFGRQHYLRFETPRTWQIWNECNLDWGSTMSYADCSGFRCGVCYPFPVFDILNRKELTLWEKPLIVMEGSLLSYESLSIEEAKIKVQALKYQVKKYNGEFVFLYHNSSFFEGVYRKDGNELLHALYN